MRKTVVEDPTVPNFLKDRVQACRGLHLSNKNAKFRVAVGED